MSCASDRNLQGTMEKVTSPVVSFGYTLLELPLSFVSAVEGCHEKHRHLNKVRTDCFTFYSFVLLFKTFMPFFLLVFFKPLPLVFVLHSSQKSQQPLIFIWLR